MLKDHNINNQEYKMILEIMGREPNILELGIFRLCGVNIALINLQKMVKNTSHNWEKSYMWSR